MSALLQIHKAEFQEWCAQALRYHADGDGRSALMHARLCGEVACKITLLQGWTEARAMEAISGGNFQDLLMVVQRNAMVPAQLLSGLHVLRSTGNKAAHGGSFAIADADLAMAALRMVAERLYSEVLKEPLPDRLAGAIAGNDPRERLARERDALRRELDEERLTKKKARDRDAQRAAEEQRSTAEREERIRTIEQRLENLAQAQAEPQRTRDGTREATIAEVPASPSATHHTPARRGSWMRWWMLVPVVLVMVATVAWFLVADRAAGDVPPVAVDEVEVGTMRVLLVPFAVLQDDPNVRISIHDALRKRLEERSAGLPLDLHIITDTAARPGTISEAAAIALAREHEARVVLFGEVYEPTATDSGRIELRYADTTASSTNGTMGLRAFRTLADSAAIRTLMAAHTITEYAVASLLFEDRRYSDALAMLYTTPTVTIEGRMGVQLYRAMCYQQLKDYPRAMRELEQVLAQNPGNALANASMGNVLAANGDRTAAVRFLGKAVTLEPRNPAWCMQLAHLVGDDADPANFDPPRVKMLVAQALRADTSRADIWDAMGEIAKSEGRLADARDHFEHALRKDSTYTQAQHDLAELLAVDTDPPDYEQAEQLLRKVLRADSSRAHAALLLAQVLNQRHKEPLLAQQLFRKSQEEDPKWRLSALRGQARSAAERGDVNAAIGYYQQAIAIDPADLMTSVRLGKLYQQRGEFDRMLREMQRFLALDSMGHEVNLNLGAFYHNAPPPYRDLNKAELHLRRALLTDPYDVFNMAELAAVLTLNDKTEEASTLCERVVARDPDRFNCNVFLGRAYHLRERFAEARICYERALRARPADPMAMAGLAGVLVDIGPQHRAHAIALLEQALQVAPGEGMLHYNLATFHLNFGEKARAAEYYRQAIALDPTLRDPAMEGKLRAAGY